MEIKEEKVIKRWREELTSTCCDASVYDNWDWCSKCKDHCSAVDENGVEHHFTVNRWEPTKV